MKRIHQLDDNFFEAINSESAAYFLGFIYADGNVYSSKKWNSSVLTITQSQKDVDILYLFKKHIKSDKDIRKIIIGGKDYFEMSINSVKLCSDLKKHGVVENKSLILTFPDFIDEDLMHHFIRGYFDGDGCIWEGKRKKMIVKDLSRKDGIRERIIHNVKITFTGSNTFIPFLQEYLISVIGLPKTKLNYSKSKTEHKHCVMEYSGRKNILSMYNFMYKNATCFSKRKKDKFEDILRHESNCNI